MHTDTHIFISTHRHKYTWTHVHKMDTHKHTHAGTGHTLLYMQTDLLTYRHTGSHTCTQPHGHMCYAVRHLSPVPICQSDRGAPAMPVTIPSSGFNLTEGYQDWELLLVSRSSRCQDMPGLTVYPMDMEGMSALVVWHPKSWCFSDRTCD